MATSAAGAAGPVSVALMLPGTGSLVPSGGVTVTVLLSVPVAAAGTRPVTTKLALVPTGSVTRASMSPLPLAVPHAAPAPLAVQVQVNPASGAGNTSCTRA